MVDLNPVLSCLCIVEEFVSRGETVRDGLNVWLATGSGRERQDFRDDVFEFLRANESHAPDSSFSKQNRTFRTVFRESLFRIFEAGLTGQAVLPNLKELRLEIEAQLELDIKAHVDGLPLKMLAPLLLCMFPAFLILLLGPITRNFLEALR